MRVRNFMCLVCVRVRACTCACVCVCVCACAHMRRHHMRCDGGGRRARSVGGAAASFEARQNHPHTTYNPASVLASYHLLPLTQPPCLSPFVSLSRLPLERSTHSFYGDSNAIFQQCGRWPGQGHVEGEGERSGGAAAGTGGAAAGLSQGPSPLLRVSIGDASLRSIICVEYRYLSIYLLACGQLDV